MDDIVRRTVGEYLQTRTDECARWLVVEVADRDTLFANPSHPYTRSLLSAVPDVDPEVETVRQRIVLRGDVPSPLTPPLGVHVPPALPRTGASAWGPLQC